MDLGHLGAGGPGASYTRCLVGPGRRGGRLPGLKL